jgi:hypothetical protein
VLCARMYVYVCFEWIWGVLRRRLLCLAQWEALGAQTCAAEAGKEGCLPRRATSHATPPSFVSPHCTAGGGRLRQGGERRHRQRVRVRAPAPLGAPALLSPHLPRPAPMSMSVLLGPRAQL